MQTRLVCSKRENGFCPEPSLLALRNTEVPQSVPAPVEPVL